MWYAKMYFSGEKEFFENDAFGMQGLPSKQLELPFLESLLTFLELDEKEITPMLERISANWERFVESRDREAYTAAMVELGVLAEKHIYLRLLYTRCYSCSSRRDLGKAPLQAISLDLKLSYSLTNTMLYPFLSNAKSKIPIPEKNEKIEILFCIVFTFLVLFVHAKLIKFIKT